jgi:uncharacterized protein (TIGR02646 family)
MRFIEKRAEPEGLKQFKDQENADWLPTYKKFQNPQKLELQEILIAEQGHICCYCGIRISLADSHIEHFQPQEIHPEKQLEYSNLLASCLRQPASGDPLHCGVSKDNWYDQHLTVSPIIADCADFFEYQADGKILPSQDSSKNLAAQETIQRLKLNISKLAKNRAKSLEGLGLDDLSLAEIEKIIDQYDQKNEDGQYEPFCQMLIYCLEQEKLYHLSGK